MSYSKESIAESASAVPSMPAQQLREEREINPYSNVSRNKTNIGQSSNNSSSAAVESAKTEETVTLSPQMAALARKEQKFRQQQQATKDKEAALEARAAKVAKLEALEAKLEAGDYSDLDGRVSYDKYTQWKIDQASSMSPEQQALKEVKAELDTVKKNIQDDISKRFDSAVNERRNAVNALVDKSPEYSGLKTLNMQEAVLQHILQTWEHDNTELSPEQAAKEVKEALKEQANKLAVLREDSSPSQVEDKKQLPPLKQGIKTLTNQMATSGEIKRPVKSFQHMSDTERWAEARRRAEDKLKGNK